MHVEKLLQMEDDGQQIKGSHYRIPKQEQTYIAVQYPISRHECTHELHQLINEWYSGMLQTCAQLSTMAEEDTWNRDSSDANIYIYIRMNCSLPAGATSQH